MALHSTAPSMSVPPNNPMVLTTLGAIHQGLPSSSISNRGVENMNVGYWNRRWRRMFRFRGSEKEYFIPCPSGRRTTWASWVTMSTTT